MTALDDIRAMTDEEMNEAIAIEVMGWHLVDYNGVLMWEEEEIHPILINKACYQPSIGLNRCYEAELYLTNTCNLHARFVRILDEMGWGGNPTIPARHRCEAMLMAVREGNG